ncbi:MAG: zinc-ribbon and DUF3426 domain-containing protein [Candidatus Reddybacter sp.]
MSKVAARCPSCQSVFYVSAAQGKVANNLVRCGRCGHQFSVLENPTGSLPESKVVPGPPEPEIESEPEMEGGVSDSEEALAIIDEPAQDSRQVDASEPEGDSSVEGSTQLDCVPVSTFELSNLAARLPDDFELESISAAKTGIGRQLSLGLVIVLLAFIGLGVQFVFFKLPTLSQQLAYRPWLQSFCALLPCELDAYSEHGLISVERLQVRTHPDLESSLMVELVLANMASLEQAYPPLILRFDDLSGVQVAARRLSVEEYLPRSLSGNRLMPVDKAVSIKLGILDPGERALSYSVSVGQ